MRNLTDDELWRAIAANTEATSDLLHQRVRLDAEISTMTDPVRRSKLMTSYLGTVNKLESEYRACMVELRRRYPASEERYIG
jgi:hypothetical protein